MERRRMFIILLTGKPIKAWLSPPAKTITMLLVFLSFPPCGSKDQGSQRNLEIGTPRYSLTGMKRQSPVGTGSFSCVPAEMVTAGMDQRRSCAQPLFSTSCSLWIGRNQGAADKTGCPVGGSKRDGCSVTRAQW